MSGSRTGIKGLNMKLRQTAAGLIPIMLLAPGLAALDLTQAVVVTPDSLDGPERKAVQSLVEEIEKRTAVRLPVEQAWPSADAPAIAVGPLAKAREFAGEFAVGLDSADKPGPEGYVIRTGDNAVVIGGADPRGVLFGVGHLLRKLEMRPASVRLPDPLDLSTTPETGLRGHQLGYRPKTNSYDAWTVGMWEQYIRELALFGANAIEIIPPRSDDDADSPHFPLPQIDMMARAVAHRRRVRPGYLDLVPRSGRELRRPRTNRVRARGMGNGLRAPAAHRLHLRPRRRPGATPGRFIFSLCWSGRRRCSRSITRTLKCGCLRKASTPNGWKSSTT